MRNKRRRGKGRKPIPDRVGNAFQLGSIVERTWNFKDAQLREKVQKAWQQAVSPQIANNAWILNVRGGVITIGVRAHTWYHEINNFKKPEILCALNNLLGEEVLITDLRVKVI
mgnify:CR=1 FL=1